MKKVRFISHLFLSAFMLFAASCSDDKDDPINQLPDETDDSKPRVFHIAARFDGRDSEVYMAGVEDLSKGSLSFKGNGYAINPVRSARVFTDNLGWVYVFDYGGGYLQKFSYNNGSYTKVKELDVAPVMGGVPHVRPWKINEETILIHNIIARDIEDSGNGINKEADMYVTRMEIPLVAIADILETWTIPAEAWDVEEKAYVFRVDAPTVLDDKIYYGLGRRAIDNTIPLTGMHTIVLDYPSLTNPKYIRSEKGTGNTNGYRGGNMHAIGEYVYQANRATGENATMILRLKDGEYDNNWEFNVTAALGETFNTNNWYHAGNGICYVSAQFTNAEDENNQWGVVRMDLNNKTAIKMNVPMSDLFGYQNGVTIDDKFYMAVSPVGSTGESAPFVYIFDIDSTDPNAFTKGLELDKGNIFVEGIF
ncbi:hypothetical protein [Alkalitalea saponilacus]|uniref:DUF4374 domain-containing protein n=1 Tax=Alkalitalea saponilacus TaxID=889453 RepID=A0A1T5AQK8_9BACT|nr:hypothetical protein [Alkalitalea saponilacus]ASB48625.1 hypothetical protein CDL62_05455 [Alkalitalea saponilacus]SKB37321.1 hypothetical protein SAMN03080601_00348 [Alkalitalea saponilacus]